MLSSLIVTAALLGQVPSGQYPSYQGPPPAAFNGGSYYHSETFAATAPASAPCAPCGGASYGSYQATYSAPTAAPCATGRRGLFRGGRFKEKHVFKGRGCG